MADILDIGKYVVELFGMVDMHRLFKFCLVLSLRVGI